MSEIPSPLKCGDLLEGGWQLGRSSVALIKILLLPAGGQPGRNGDGAMRSPIASPGGSRVGAGLPSVGAAFASATRTRRLGTGTDTARPGTGQSRIF